MFNLNPPTERGIDKVLKHIAEQEELCLADSQLLEIRNQCNKDLRNAIITLQFLAAGKTLECMSSQQITAGGGKRKRGNHVKRNVIEEEEDDFMSSQKTKTDQGDQAKLIL